jgi:electron transfer flavoprotein alpha subunit
MDFAVLVKAVPSLEELRFDPVRKTVDRATGALFLNPFDQRALRVALDLRRPGEQVSVVSVGPREALEPLRDVVALGADRSILVSDPALAGSDTLATSRTIVAALGRVGHELVVAGSWTTDSETGQVGPEVAGLLDVPAALDARAIERDPHGPGLRITVDTSEGWARYHLVPPALVTVGEKITKPGKVAPEARARAAASAIEVLSLADLGVAAERVGLSGSPTVVRWVKEDAPRRKPVILAGGPPGERAQRAVAEVGRLLARGIATTAARPFRPAAFRDDREVGVLVTGVDGRLDLASGSRLAQPGRSMPGHWSSAIWIGDRPSAAETARLAHGGISVGYLVPTTAPVDPRAAARGFGSVLDRRPTMAAALFGADGYGREVAGRVAAARGLGLVGDAIEVGIEEGAVLWSKPSFGGRTVAGVVSRTVPSLATVRPGVWTPELPLGLHEELEWTALPPTTGPGARRPEATGVEVAPGTRPLEEAQTVVVAGMGVGGPAGIESLRPFAERLNAGLGATRRVVDAGWVPRQFQVGLTGRMLAPRLAILVGVSGAANHLVGLRRAGAILAVNRDAAAPVFRDVDVGIVGTIEETVPVLATALGELLDRSRPTDGPMG